MEQNVQTITNSNRIKRMPCGMYCDFGTSNQSFLDVANVLRKKGIKKWYFMLEVKFPKTGVHLIDPMGIDATKQESAKDMGKIHLECKANVWFFVRECARVPARGAPSPFQFKLNRAACAMIWCYQKGIDFMVCQPRQTHKTTTCMVLSEYSLIYRYSHVEIPFMHLKEDRVRTMALELRGYIYALPDYINPFSEKGKPPGPESIKYDAHDTSIKLLTSAENESKAKDKLRGMTVFTACLDEWEYMPHIKHILAGGSPAIVQARRLGKMTDIKTCIMLASTPGNLETEEGQQALAIINETPVWSECFYDIADNNLEEALTFTTPSGQVRNITNFYIEYNHIQIFGLIEGAKWLTEQYEEAVRNNEMSEYIVGCLLRRTRSSDSSLFRQEDITYIMDHIREHDHEILVLNKYPMKIYEHEIANIDITSNYPYFDTDIPYLIGIDVASGSDQDSTVFTVVHPYTLQVVGVLGSPLMGAIDQMQAITFLSILIPRGLFCPETNNVGKTLVDFFQESPNLIDRVYYDPNLDLGKNVISPVTEQMTISLKRKAQNKKYIGVNVNAKNREDMFTLLKKILRNYRHLINTKELVDEISKLIKTKTGKIAAMNGAHDDHVMSYLHVLYILHYGANIDRFGINKDFFMWEKSGEILEEYDKRIEIENTVITPFDGHSDYENKLRDDIINGSNGFDIHNGLDPYGYTKNQYNQTSSMFLQPPKQETVVSYSSEDYAFLDDANDFY